MLSKGSQDRPILSEEEKNSEIFNRYLTNLGIGSDEIVKACILDVGASTGRFADAAISKGAELVVSVDVNRPVGRVDVLKGNNIKLYDTCADDESIDVGLQNTQGEKTKFDLITSHAALLYSDVIDQQNIKGQWIEQIDWPALVESTKKTIDFLLSRLNEHGGRLIIFPYFPSQGEINFKGDVKNFGEYNILINHVLSQVIVENADIDFLIEKVREIDGVKYYRILLKKKLRK